MVLSAFAFEKNIKRKMKIKKTIKPKLAGSSKENRERPLHFHAIAFFQVSQLLKGQMSRNQTSEQHKHPALLA